jgi:DNA-binding NarL/FixJ family response regulator
MDVESTLPRAVIADDHPAILEKVSEILAGKASIVASAHDGVASVRAVTLHNPDVLVIDIVMPHLNGIEAAREIRGRSLHCRIIFLTIQEDPEYLRIAQDIGASYVLKRKMRTDLLAALESELQGSHFYSSL